MHSDIRVASHLFWLYILIFIFSCGLLALAGEWMIKAIMRIAKFLGWREFVVAFFAIAFGASTSNLFVGISAAFHGIPELSFGDIVSSNVIDLTLAVFLAVIIGRAAIAADSGLVRKSALFTAIIAFIPLFLILDGTLSRGDGLILIIVFLGYLYWLFSKSDRFTKSYDGEERIGFRTFFKDLLWLVLSLILVLFASEGIVRTAVFFADGLNISLIHVGILVVALGNALPETYFAVASARKGQNWMVLGGLMGSVISCSTLVLGVVALIKPIEVSNLPSIAIARFFLIISALFFLFFTWTGKKISRKEAIFLFLLYAVFIILELWIM